MAGKYDFGYKVYHGSTVEWALQNIKANSIVLEFGPFNGNLTKHLKENLSCQVDIVELDEEAGEAAKQFARDALIGSEKGDIEKYYWTQQFKGRKYDYIVFLDVLEHLVDTEKILKYVKGFLKDDGVILLSIPNIAYNGVIINLLNNKFHYTETGLLDSTHLRFFTYDSIMKLGQKMGYSVKMEALQLPILKSETNTSYEMVPLNVAYYLKQREFANVYQFLVILGNSTNVKEESKLELENVDNNILVSVYIQNENDTDYSEQKKFYIYTQAYSKINVEIDLSMAGVIRNIRLDPIENACYLKNILVSAKTVDNNVINLPIISSNGIRVKDGLLFTNNDPQIYFEKQNTSYKSLSFSCEIVSCDGEQIAQIASLQLWNNEQIELKENNYKKSLLDLQTQMKLKEDNYKKLLFDLRTQIELCKSDLSTVLALKENCEEELFLIQTSKIWRVLQWLAKIKIRLLRG